jgi:PAS domain S-box-containing protein
MSTPEITEHPRPKHRFKHLFNSIQDAVVEIEVIDGEPIVCSVNQGFETLFGYDADEIVGNSLNRFIVPDDYETEATQLDARTADGKYNDRVVTRETATGERVFLYRGVPYEQDGRRFAFAVYSDITDQKRREAELERKNKQLDEFASILTHDLRNPINIAEGYLDQIKTPDNEECVELVERAHNRMKAIIEDTLTLSRESQSVEAVVPVAAATLAESAWELVETNGSELRVDEDFEILCDDDRIARLFENLFRNAIDHNDDPVTVSVGIHHTMTTATRGEAATAFYVADDGCGIPKSEREHVFEIGETTARGGTGLGLPIIKRIADAHQWDVQVAGSVDGGAKFVFTNVEIR